MTKKKLQDREDRIYIFKNPITEYIKIGVSSNVEKRRTQLSYQGGVELEILYISEPTTRAFEIEAQLHAKFIRHNALGEWFKDLDPRRVTKYIRDMFGLKGQGFIAPTAEEMEIIGNASVKYLEKMFGFDTDPYDSVTVLPDDVIEDADALVIGTVELYSDQLPPRPLEKNPVVTKDPSPLSKHD